MQSTKSKGKWLTIWIKSGLAMSRIVFLIPVWVAFLFTNSRPRLWMFVVTIFHTNWYIIRHVYDQSMQSRLSSRLGPPCACLPMLFAPKYPESVSPCLCVCLVYNYYIVNKCRWPKTILSLRWPHTWPGLCMYVLARLSAKALIPILFLFLFFLICQTQYCGAFNQVTCTHQFQSIYVSHSSQF